MCAHPAAISLSLPHEQHKRKGAQVGTSEEANAAYVKRRAAQREQRKAERGAKRASASRQGEHVDQADVREGLTC